MKTKWQPPFVILKVVQMIQAVYSECNGKLCRLQLKNPFAYYLLKVSDNRTEHLKI